MDPRNLKTARHIVDFMNEEVEKRKTPSIVRLAAHKGTEQKTSHRHPRQVYIDVDSDEELSDTEPEEVRLAVHVHKGTEQKTSHGHPKRVYIDIDSEGELSDTEPKEVRLAVQVSANRKERQKTQPHTLRRPRRIYINTMSAEEEISDMKPKEVRLAVQVSSNRTEQQQTQPHRSRHPHTYSISLSDEDTSSDEEVVENRPSTNDTYIGVPEWIHESRRMRFENRES